MGKAVHVDMPKDFDYHIWMPKFNFVLTRREVDKVVTERCLYSRKSSENAEWMQKDELSKL